MAKAARRESNDQPAQPDTESRKLVNLVYAQSLFGNPFDDAAPSTESAGASEAADATDAGANVTSRDVGSNDEFEAETINEAADSLEGYQDWTDAPNTNTAVRPIITGQFVPLFGMQWAVIDDLSDLFRKIVLECTDKEVAALGELAVAVKARILAGLPPVSDAFKKALIEISSSEAEDKLKKVTVQKSSVYDAMKPNEAVADFVLRTYERAMQRSFATYRGVDEDGDIVPYLINAFGPYLDGKLFSRAVLGKLDKAAYRAVVRYLTRHKTLPHDLSLPSKPEQSELLAEPFTDGERRAVTAVSRRYE
jgi:hypothetical protein